MPTVWKINDDETLSAPGSSLLVFHDFYPEGHQGGIELLLHGERLLTNGDVRLVSTPGQWDLIPEVISRSVIPGSERVDVSLKYPQVDIHYLISLWGEGESIHIQVVLQSELPADLPVDPGFNFELFPPAYFGKSYHIGDSYGVFPPQANGPTQADATGQSFGSGPRLVAALEDEHHHIEINREDGALILLDGRNNAENGWFVVRAPITHREAGIVVSLSITPHRIPGWHRQPVMLFSQVGYHPMGEKRLLVELDPSAPVPGPVSLEYLDPSQGFVPVCAGGLLPWGRFLCYDYGVFDFTLIDQPGLYQLRLGNQVTPPFPIAEDVYQRNVWQPTFETHFPVQMCHMAVLDNMRIWHAACHLDDALQAPLHQVHFDSYRQSGETETPYQPLEHIPYLDQGGWHDAGDFDLAAGSQASTTFTLALVREVFELSSDQTTVRWEDRTVLLHKPDGIPDIVQQVAHGALNLLSGYRVYRHHGEPGHSFIGIIEDTLDRYAMLGDTASMTDNRVYDGKLGSQDVVGERSGKLDDRWAFTNRHTALEYKVIGALLAAGRVLKGWYDDLAEECLQTAQNAWETEHKRPIAVGPNCYVPGHPDVQEILAAIELLVTWQHDTVADWILSRWDTIQSNFSSIAWSLARVAHLFKDTDFNKKFYKLLEKLAQDLEEELARNPFGVPFHPHVWGVGWSIQAQAVQVYFLVRQYPNLFGSEIIQRAFNYMLGCHPASSTSLVSGVGAQSLLVAYGQNRAEWSYIPGGVASGPNLVRPDFPELKEPYPYIWQQSEYVIGGAASHIFLTLAVDELLKEK